MPWIVMWARESSAASRGTEEVTQVYWRNTPVRLDEHRRLEEHACEEVPSWMGEDRTPEYGFREYDVLPLDIHQEQVENHERSYNYSLEMLTRLRSQRPEPRLQSEQAKAEAKLKKLPKPKTRLDRLTEPLELEEAPAAKQGASPPKAAASTRVRAPSSKPERLKKLPTKRQASP